MRYMGGKSKIAKAVVELMLNKHPETTRVWDAFCGGLSVAKAFAQAGKQVLASDENLALITTYKAAAAGWDPPIVAEGLYRAARALPDTDPLKALAGFACSFGGKWFGGFARGEGRCFADEGRRALLDDVAHVKDFARIDFLSLPAEAEPGLLIYCDPPYAGTTGYRQGSFDHEAFWQRCREWVAVGVPIFVSEYTAPEDFMEVWAREQFSTVSRDKSKRVMRERLFQHVSQVNAGKEKNLLPDETPQRPGRLQAHRDHRCATDG